jgi:hypothetical protein
MMSDPQRSDPFAGNLDLSDFKPAAPKRPKIEPAAIREVSEANNFPSRAAPSKPKAVKAGAGAQRRRRTGRNVQFNIKTTPDVIERFTALADKNGWVFGELLEHALNALEKSSSKA